MVSRETFSLFSKIAQKRRWPSLDPTFSPSLSFTQRTSSWCQTTQDQVRKMNNMAMWRSTLLGLSSLKRQESILVKNSKKIRLRHWSSVVTLKNAQRTVNRLVFHNITRQLSLMILRMQSSSASNSIDPNWENSRSYLTLNGYNTTHNLKRRNLIT